MVGGRSFSRRWWPAVTVLAWGFTAWVALDTARTVLRFWSPLPYFDAWATTYLVQLWQGGDMSAVDVLVSQHNEHRILVPRLVFFADDALLGGRDILNIGAVFAVQALHAAVFAAVLARARRPGSWALAAVVAALMSGLRQAENFSSGFQLQFVAVFAGATLSFVLAAAAAARARRGAPFVPPLLASLAAVLLTSFTMANGLAAGFIVALIAAAARLPRRATVLCGAWAVLIAAAYLWGYEPVDHHSRPADSLGDPVRLLLYVAAYLGSVVSSGDIPLAAGFGAAGLAAAAAAAGRSALRRTVAPSALAMVGVMGFVVATAVLTGLGRVEFGVGQALSSRYSTGSVAFWAAQLTYWSIDPPTWPSRRGAAAFARGGVALAAVLLCWSVATEQSRAKLPFAVQKAAEDEASDLLMLGLYDPAVVGRVAWSGVDIPALLAVMKADRLSIFDTADFAGIGHPVTDRGKVLSPDLCGGAVARAAADPTLGADGVRVDGTAWEGPDRRSFRRVLLADGGGKLVGFGSGAIPGAARSDWRGFAVAPAGAALTAYGVLPGSRLCRVGEAAVSPPTGR